MRRHTVSASPWGRFLVVLVSINMCVRDQIDRNRYTVRQSFSQWQKASGRFMAGRGRLEAKQKEPDRGARARTESYVTEVTREVK